MSYSRLFPRTSTNHDAATLARLAERMQPPRGRQRTQRTPFSGYVYFGQFIDHDLTRDETKLEQAESAVFDPEYTINHRRPYLDLDSLYGEGPVQNDELYNLKDFHVDNARFRFGRTDATHTSQPSTPNDLPRRSDQTAIIIDDRNDENPILSQLHVLFLKFHNRICELLEAKPPQIDSSGGGNIFEQARRLVTWHYQWLVCNDFLPEVTLPSILEDIRQRGRILFKIKPGDPFALPIEFTMAAFRFGHSMVQNTYTLNDSGQELKLSDLFNLTRTSTGERKPLPADAVIDWGRFFGIYHDGKTEFAETIDTYIADGLFHLPPELVALFTRGSSATVLSLPLRTLRRGAAARLPSAQEACQAARISGVQVNFIPFAGEEEAFLRQNGFLEETPLWYYLLHEAQIEGKGRRLGSLGSRIVGEVLLGTLEVDPNSFVSSGWRPPTPKIVYGPSSKPKPISTLQQLFFFAANKSIDDFDLTALRESIRNML